MSLIRLAAALLALAAAACASTPDTTLAMAPSPLIDQPVSPFPYNSRFCP